MIKIRFRKNLLYLFIYYISAFIDITIIGNVILSQFAFDPLLICIYIYPLENIIGGLIVYLYQQNSVKKNHKVKYFGLDIYHQKNVVIDGKCKKILLIFIASYFNYYNIIVSLFYYIDYIPLSMDLRLSSIQIITSAFICAFSFDFKFKKHHKLSLIVIGICLFLSISHDMLYIIYYGYKNLRVPIFQYFTSLYYYIGFSFNNCIEKYLVDADYMNPFFILMIEGIFQLLMAFLTPIWGYDPFKDFRQEKVQNNLALFIFLFILYILFQIVVNIYRIYCNVIYSPMARSLIDYFLNPFINIYFFFVERKDFENVAYFIVTEIFCCTMSFFGCVFNEYIILYCCDLESETQDEIADRGEKPMRQTELKLFLEKENNDENDNEIKDSSTVISIDSVFIKM